MLRVDVNSAKRFADLTKPMARVASRSHEKNHGYRAVSTLCELSSMSVTVHDGNSLFLVNYATQILCFIVTTPFVFLRIFVRWKVNRVLGIDDGMCAMNPSVEEQCLLV